MTANNSEYGLRRQVPNGGLGQIPPYQWRAHTNDLDNQQIA